MEGYNYPPYAPPPAPFMQMMTPEGAYPDHGDGFGDYYPMSPMCGHQSFDPRYLLKQPCRPIKPTTRKHRDYRHRSRSTSRSLKSRSRSRTPSRARDKSRSRSRSPATIQTATGRTSKIIREPSFLDAFRVLYLTPSQTKKNTPKFLATKKSQDRIQELLKRDGLGSKKWLFYPRPKEQKSPDMDLKDDLKTVEPRESCDQRVKLDADFFRKYKKNTKVALDAPIAKLKRWELILYKKLGFIQAV